MGLLRALPLALCLVMAVALFGRGDQTPSLGAGPLPASFASVCESLTPSVAHITTQTSRTRSRDENVGAGFVWRGDGIVVTNRHVVSGARELRVSVGGGPLQAAQVLGVDEPTDIAVLKVATIGPSAAPIPRGDSRALRVGDWVLAAGSPYRLPASWSVGIVSGLHRRGIGLSPRAYEDYIQTDAAANLGNSGGPLVDATGRVVGVVTAILSRGTGHQGVSLAVPIEVVTASVERILGGGTAPARPSLGVRVRPIATGGVQGLAISRFETGSRAQAAGFQVGDVLLTLDGESLRSAADLQRAWWARAGQPRVMFVFLRGGSRFQLPVSAQ